MLLSMMRKHATSWLIKFMISIIALVFIFYFGYSFRSEEGGKVAEVNGESIGRIEYDREYRDLVTNLQNEYKSVWSDKLIKAFDLENMALESLIEKKIIKQEAEKIGLKVTPDEIREEIFKIPAFQENGRFDENRYRSLLAYNREKPEDFEEKLSRELLQQKLIQFLTTFLIPGDQDILDNYKYSNEKIKLGFIKFSPDDYKSGIEKDKSLIEPFFKERKEDYRTSDKIKISYIRISPDNYKDKAELDEEELVNYFEDNLDMFTQEKQVKARHILFNLSPGATPEKTKEVKEKALAVLEKVKQGDDFAKLATEHSEDPSKTKGGDLGYLKKGQMYRALEEFEDVAFSLEKGGISDLVRTSLGYHIIKVEDIKDKATQKYTEVRGQISSIFTQNMSLDLANEKALSLIDQMPYDVDLAEYASLHDVPIESTDFFSKFDPIPLITSNDKLVETLFALEKGDVSELIELNNEFYIIQILDKKASYLPELDEVLVAVDMDYVDHMALKEAKSEAEKYFQELKEDKGWEDLAKEKGKTPESTDFFSRLDFPSKIGTTPGIHEAALN